MLLKGNNKNISRLYRLLVFLVESISDIGTCKKTHISTPLQKLALNPLTLDQHIHNQLTLEMKTRNLITISTEADTSKDNIDGTP